MSMSMIQGMIRWRKWKKKTEISLVPGAASPPTVACTEGRSLPDDNAHQDVRMIQRNDDCWNSSKMEAKIMQTCTTSNALLWYAVNPYNPQEHGSRPTYVAYHWTYVYGTYYIKKYHIIQLLVYCIFMYMSISYIYIYIVLINCI